MVSDAEPGALRDEVFVISPNELREQFKNRKTWQQKGGNRFDLTIQRNAVDKWGRWITGLAEIG